MQAILSRLLCAAALALLALPVSAQEIRPDDAARLAALDESAGRALLRAYTDGRRGGIEFLQASLSGKPVAPLATKLPGDYRCRFIRMRPDNPIFIYATFICRITADGDGFILEKLTGTERARGRISLVDGRMIYLGAGAPKDTQPPDYADLPAVLPDVPSEDLESWPQVGVVEQTRAGIVRVLMPQPARGGDLDILYLTP